MLAYAVMMENLLLILQIGDVGADCFLPLRYRKHKETKDYIMKYFNFLLLQMLLLGSFNAQEFDFDDGIYYEKPLYRDTSKHKYSKDNISYKVNAVFIYDYYYLDKDGSKKKFLHTKDFSYTENPLNLVNYDYKIGDVIDKIKIVVDDDLKLFAGNDSDYTQTVFSLFYLLRNGNSADTIFGEVKSKNPNMLFSDEQTGVIDNKKNLWMHPPRTFSFRILQLNPFPFYCLDENIKTWSWNLVTGGFWLDQRWIKHEGQESITVHFNYKRQADETIETPLGKLTCKVTDGTGTSDNKDGLFKTHLKSFYYPKYGFVRLEYTNINGTNIFNILRLHFCSIQISRSIISQWA